ncbi:MAG: hypothetical protein ACOCVF_00710 [bacterium]
MCLNFLKKYICGKSPKIEYVDTPDLFSELAEKAQSYNPDDFIKISGRDLKITIMRKLGSNLKTGFSYKDKYYYMCPLDLLDDFHQIYRKYIIPKYKSEVFDCDNYAVDYLAMLSRFAYYIPNQKYSFALGITNGNFYWVNTNHQVNFFMDTNKELQFIEPQNLKIYPIYDNKINIVYI